jgi:NAD(P)-dependent dehydrogenase (short-subunit alcohol dehydrogenase family)
VLIANAGTSVPGYFLDQVPVLQRNAMPWTNARMVRDPRGWSTHARLGPEHDRRKHACWQEVNQFRQAMEANYMSTVHLIKAAAPGMVEAREVCFPSSPPPLACLRSPPHTPCPCFRLSSSTHLSHDAIWTLLCCRRAHKASDVSSRDGAVVIGCKGAWCGGV